MIISFSVFVFSITAVILRLVFREKIEIREQLDALSSLTGQENTQNGSRTKAPVKRERKTHSTRLHKLMTTLENELYDTGVQIQAENFVIIWIFMTFVIPLLMLFMDLPAAAAVCAAVIIAMAPLIYIKIHRTKRRKVLESQLIDAITIMCNAMKAGHSFQSAMDNIATEMKGPISDEFGRVFRETLHGMSIEESLRRMVERVGSPELEMLSTAVSIQRETGGNMSEILANISGTIQSRVIMRNEVKTRTASGRVSGYIVGALPIVLLIAMSVVNPEYCAPLFTTDTGKLMLLAGAVLEVTGFLVINRIISVKY